MADAAAAKQIVTLNAQIVLGSDPFANAPVLTAIGEAVKEAQDRIISSGGDVTKDFKFAVSVEAEKAPRQPRQPRTPATPPSPAPAPAPAPAAAQNGSKNQ